MPSGKYVPVIPAQSKLAAIPVPPKPIVPNADPNLNLTLITRPKSNILNLTLLSMEDWDVWPDGNFEKDFSWPEFKETSNLSVHWAVRVNGGDH